MERNPDAGHTHLKTLRFVTGCPLCEAEKAVRNQAIEHLSEALHLLEGLRKPGDKPTIRLNLAPIGVTGDDVDRCHSFDLSAKQAEPLANAIASMNAHLSSKQPVGQDGVGQWTADSLIFMHPEMAAEIVDTFLALDPREVTKDVLDNPRADNLTVNRALDDWFGEIADPYADEDDD